MQNIPINAFDPMKNKITIAVNTSSPILKTNELNSPWNLADQVISISMKYFTDSALKKADIVISPETSHLNSDFTNLDSLIFIGSQKARLKIQEIKHKTFKTILDSLKSLNINSELINANHYRNQYRGFSFEDSLSLVNGSVTIENIISGIGLSYPYQKIQFEGIDNFFKITAFPFPEIKGILIKGSNIAMEADSTLYYMKNKFYYSKNSKELFVKILNLLHSKGYDFIRILKYEFDYKNNYLIIEIDEAKIRNISISGSESLSNYLLTRELTFHASELPKIDNFFTSSENLLSSELIKDVDLITKYPKDTSGLDLIIRVQEAEDQLVKFGAKIDNERNTQAGLDLIQNNIHNTGARAIFRIAGGNRNGFSSFSINVPRLLFSMITLNLNIYTELRDYYYYANNENQPSNRFLRNIAGELQESRMGTKLSFGSQIEKKGSLFAEYRFEQQRTYDLAANPTPYYSISSLKFATIFDSEDDIQFPRIGRYIDMSLETSFLEPKDGVGFSKINYFHRQNFSMGRHTISTSFMFGFADASTPDPELFSIGGIGNFYGLHEDDYRGRQIVSELLEYRFRSPISIFFDTYFYLHYNIGGIWSSPEDMKLTALKQGLGLSLGLATPIGPAKFSFGNCFYANKGYSNLIFGPLMFYFSLGTKI